MADVEVQLSESDADHAEAQALLATIIEGIADDAVPRTVEGRSDFNTTLAVARDITTNELVGAALTCRSRLAAMSIRGGRRGTYRPVLDKHSELDLLGVLPERRREGIGSQMLLALERHLSESGVRFWFGVAQPSDHSDEARSFYERHKFVVGPPGQPLPPLMGRNWTLPGMAKPAFHFYKRLN